MPPIASLSCRESFTISHYLNRFVWWSRIRVNSNHCNSKYNNFSPLLSSTVNKSVYGICKNPVEHKHDFVVEVIIRGMVDSNIGTVTSLSDLKSHLRKTVNSKLNGKHLNSDIDFFKSVVRYQLVHYKLI